ncbi:hypothetical protein DL96DRAFT_1411239, partial [Flagelloscypha sp. PMI_526]
QRVSCTPGTRVTILQKLLDWATTHDYDIKNALFWLYGLAGTGKTTILRDICETLQKLNLLASSYFCSIQLSSGDSRHLIPTLARHLASRSQAFKAALVDQLERDPDLVSATLRIQFKNLLCKPWKAVADSRVSAPAQVVAIDALDECDQGEEFLHILLDAIDDGQLEGIRFIVTSRPVPHLLRKVRDTRPDSPQVSLHEVPKDEANSDIKRYLEASLTLPEPRINELVARADGLFIYASTLVKYLRPSQLLAPIEFERRLEMIIAQRPEKSSINPLYKQIVDVALSLDDEGAMQRRWTILHVILCAAELLQALLGIDPHIVTAVVESLYSVLFAEDFDGPIYIFHASFHDFVSSCIDGEHYSHPHSIHSVLVQLCVTELTKSLRFNICGLESSFIPDADLDPPLEERVERCIGEYLAYASRHWWYHTQNCDEKSTQIILRMIEQILQEKGVFWIEVMSLLADIRRCKEVLTDLMSTFSIMRTMPTVTRLALQAVKLVSLFDTLPVRITSHLYLSCLALMEEMPEIKQWRDQFLFLPQVVTRQPMGNQFCQVVINVGASVRALAASPDGKYIVSGSIDHIVHLWDAESGRNLWKRGGHSFVLHSVTFSSDGKRIICGCDDSTLRLLDANSGEQLQVLEGHTNCVNSVAASADGRHVVSGSDDHSVRLWKADTGQQLRTLKSHTSRLWFYPAFVDSVAFSLDGSWLISGSRDKTVRVWSAESGYQLQKFEGHTSCVKSVAISPDDERIASGSKNGTVCIWDAESGKQPHRLEGHSHSVRSVAFSPDGIHLASGSSDKTVRIWDAKSGKQLRQVKNAYPVRSIAFSPDGKRIVCGSKDTLVRIWDAISGKKLQELDGHAECVRSVAYSPDGRLIVAGSDDTTVCVWDAESGKRLRKFEGHTSRVDSVAFSPDGKWVVSGSFDNSVRLWD